MPTKKKATKKTAPKKAEPEIVNNEDRLILHIALTTQENTALKLQLAKANVEKLEKESERMSAQTNRLNQQINEKYNLTPGKDKLDVNTGVITRG